MLREVHWVMEDTHNDNFLWGDTIKDHMTVDVIFSVAFTDLVTGNADVRIFLQGENRLLELIEVDLRLGFSPLLRGTPPELLNIRFGKDVYMDVRHAWG